MAAFSSDELRTQSNRLETESSVIQSYCSDIQSLCEAISAKIKEGNDNTSLELAKKWSSLGTTFETISQKVKSYGDKLHTALNKYVTETQKNETNATANASAKANEFDAINSTLSSL